MKKRTSLLSVFVFLVLFAFFSIAAEGQTQTDIPGPAGSETFGAQVAVLPNGNFVVTDPGFDLPGPITDVGAVRLYNGSTLALINTMTGTAAGDFVGSDFTGRGVTVLAAGDYVVSSSSWNGNRGAVTRCSATTGCPATISAANSLVGSAADHNIGGNGVIALPNGNYVVRSSGWDNGATDVGAITWCSSTSGCTGPVSAANSRVGSTAGDQIGLIGIIVLSNGNYVTQDLFWDNGAATDAGAITFCTGTAACTGVVSVANSLIGTTVNEFTGNQGIFPLTNGNYVVANDLWDNGAAIDAGAATFCSGTTGCTATVGAPNSLIGTTLDDHVSENGIAVLSNGNYVVRSGRWDNGAIVDAGAATFCSGTTGCTNVAVSTSNSLHGSTTMDEVGRGATALTNGNYVVNSAGWENTSAGEPNAGASTWCDGTTGCTGPVTTANSLIGDRANTGTGLAVALTNGNYVVVSQNFVNPNNFAGLAGAVTFCNGISGCVGEVSMANSLHGTTAVDQVGLVTPLTNGNYVVSSPFWDNGSTINVGAVTFCNGTTGCAVGPVTTANSLTGATANDGVGGGAGAVALSGGGYVVRSPGWDNGSTADVGAITRCDSTGCTGTPSPTNSLVGSTTGDSLGTDFGVFGLTSLPNGDYLVKSVLWDNGGITDAGAVSYGFGIGGSFGTLIITNSVRGTTASGGSGMNFSFDSVNSQLVVGRPSDNIVTVFLPFPPTAATVRVGGRVVTIDSRGIPNARVTLTYTSGNTRTALTNPFGYYRFDGVEAGQTYIAQARSKLYSFNPIVLTVKDELTDVDFVASPQKTVVFKR